MEIIGSTEGTDSIYSCDSIDSSYTQKVGPVVTVETRMTVVPVGTMGKVVCFRDRKGSSAKVIQDMWKLILNFQLQ